MTSLPSNDGVVDLHTRGEVEREGLQPPPMSRSAKVGACPGCAVCGKNSWTSGAWSLPSAARVRGLVLGPGDHRQVGEGKRRREPQRDLAAEQRQHVAVEVDAGAARESRARVRRSCWMRAPAAPVAALIDRIRRAALSSPVMPT